MLRVGNTLENLISQTSNQITTLAFRDLLPCPAIGYFHKLVK